MSVRLFVISSALMIFSWLTTTFLTVVPMETYPRPVAATVATTPANERVAQAEEGETAVREQ